MADGEGANGVPNARYCYAADRRRQLIGSPAVVIVNMSWSSKDLRRHRRHVAGRAARRKAGRPPGSYPRSDLSVRPEL